MISQELVIFQLIFLGTKLLWLGTVCISLQSCYLDIFFSEICSWSRASFRPLFCLVSNFVIIEQKIRKDSNWKMHLSHFDTILTWLELRRDLEVTLVTVELVLFLEKLWLEVADEVIAPLAINFRSEELSWLSEELLCTLVPDMTIWPSCPMASWPVAAESVLEADELEFCALDTTWSPCILVTDELELSFLSWWE